MAAKPSIQSALVIGGCGVLGHRMVTELLKLDPAPQVSVFDLRTAQNRVPSVEYHDVDITDKNAVLDALRKVKPQVIFHTASPPPGLQDLDLYLRVNVEGTRNLLDAAKVSFTSHSSQSHSLTPRLCFLISQYYSQIHPILAAV